MRVRSLFRASFAYYLRSNLVVMLGAAVASAILTGALLVGDSMRGSLRDMALRRLGPVHDAMISPRFVREALAGEANSTGLMLVPGAVTHVETKGRAAGVQVMGVRDSFWRMWKTDDPLSGSAASDTVVLNETLATEIGAKAGDDILLQLGSAASVPIDTLLGRRDRTTIALRRRVLKVLPADGPGEFCPRPQAQAPRNVFIRLDELQSALKQDDRINLLVSNEGQPGDDNERLNALNERIRAGARLADFELILRPNDKAGSLSLESRRLLLENEIEEAAQRAASEAGAPAAPLLTYLVNRFVHQTSSGPRETPYSTVLASDLFDVAGNRFFLVDGNPAPKPGSGEILINDWLAKDLDAGVGDKLRLSYYVSGSAGRLETQEAVLTVRGIVAMRDWAADPGLTPTFEGITDSKRMTDWDPPFPVDMKRIRPKDEEYWDAYRATPKAFINLDAGRKIWTEADARFGRATAYRIWPSQGGGLKGTADRFSKALLGQIKPASLGLKFQPIRSDALRAAGGATDFGMLFIGFSLFLIVAAAMLVALLFRLNAERRASQIGLMTAIGVTRQSVMRAILLEGATISVIGTLLGSAAAIGYARLMIAGLQAWWAPGSVSPHLRLHIGVFSMIAGTASSFLIAIAAMGWSIRSLLKVSPRGLLSGSHHTDCDLASRRAGRISLVTAVGGILTAFGLMGAVFAGAEISRAGAFFGSAASLLAASLAVIRIWMARGWHSRAIAPGPGALRRLSVRNAVRNRGRSLLATGLVACASFVIVAVSGSRRMVEGEAMEKNGGAGGFRMIAESVAPLGYDLGSDEGRKNLGISTPARDRLQTTAIYSCRLRPGDDTSCLNLYQALDPRIVGVPPAMIERSGFQFADSLAENPADGANPWRLLTAESSDESVPVIGDENTIRWQLHQQLGETMKIRDERGRDIPLRFVGMLSGSIFQGELLMSEKRFAELFPSRGGYQFFLVEAGPEKIDAVKKTLEQELESFGWTGKLTEPLLAEYFAVENAYLSAFQTLGGLGLVLGTFGLGAIMLRNTLERRGELALLRAVGWRHRDVARMVLLENVALLVAGLAVGSGSAILAIAPRILSNPTAVPFLSLAMTLLAVFLAGTLVSVGSLISALRTPVLPALRRE